jgi:5-methyltetrahydrofolate--homocysteine methyltransferase
MDKPDSGYKENSMNKFEQLLAEQDVILLDGAMGTMLINQGLKPGTPPELWNIEEPERIQAVHRAYIQAGSRLILTNSFGGSRIRLRKHNLENRSVELNRAAAKLARQEADRANRIIAVGGSIGPTGELMRPYGKLDYEEAKVAFAEQARALVDGGVDVLWIETMSDLNEAKAAIEGAQSSGTLPIVATMSFETKGRTMMGVTPNQALRTFTQLNLIATGANCGKGPDEVEYAINSMRQDGAGLFLVAKPNAGIPQMVNGQVVYNGTPQIMADFAKRVYNNGVKLIGACCGSTPEHILAMADALNLRSSS